jgi:hypothetical protein
MRRILTVMLLAVLLAGCQQPGQSSGVPSTAVPGDEKLQFFEPEFAAVLDQVIDRLAKACVASATDEDRLNACLRNSFSDAFDDSRQGRRECDFHVEVSDFIGCVAMGNTLIDIRHRLSDNTPVPSAFWREDDAMVDALTETIVQRGIDQCGVSGTAERVQACVMKWFETELALPASMAGRCEDQTDEKRRYVCFVEGVMVQYLQDHVSHLGALST